MKKQQLFIEGPLPGLNDLIADAKVRKNKFSFYAKTKKLWTEIILYSVLEQRLVPVKRAWLNFTWIEPNRMRDPDNISSGGRKLVLDGLRESGIIPNDGWKDIAGYSDKFCVAGKDNKPGVLVVIREAEGAE